MDFLQVEMHISVRMSVSRLKGETVQARLWIPAEEVEAQALRQLKNIASLPWVAQVAVMPDVHFGVGATVGAVIGMRGAVSPAAVGVDIGCGMGAMRTSLTASDLPETLSTLRSAIEKTIPVGFAAHDRPALERLKEAPELQATAAELFDKFGSLDGRISGLRERAALQLGTLGGGNHFIELCLDTEQRVCCCTRARATSARAWQTSTSKWPSGWPTTRSCRTGTWPCFSPARRR
jgi:tRNA-splicing ligase RtcB